MKRNLDQANTYQQKRDEERRQRLMEAVEPLLKLGNEISFVQPMSRDNRQGCNGARENRFAPPNGRSQSQILSQMGRMADAPSKRLKRNSTTDIKSCEERFSEDILGSICPGCKRGRLGVHFTEHMEDHWLFLEKDAVARTLYEKVNNNEAIKAIDKMTMTVYAKWMVEERRKFEAWASAEDQDDDASKKDSGPHDDAVGIAQNCIWD
uniref:UBZ3-type domain-containing protein n=1 Tax=Steinernema glaseri TaxID=37863 RepID=A0A1I7Y9K6_9BILA